MAMHWGDRQEGSAAYKSWRAMQWIENVYRLASLANFVAFLRYGKYRSVESSFLACNTYQIANNLTWAALCDSCNR